MKKHFSLSSCTLLEPNVFILKTFSSGDDITSPIRSSRSKQMVGYRFYPTDEELVGHFLIRKLLGYDDDDVPIPEIKVCSFEPWDLPDLLKKEADDQVCHFFSPRDYKYLGSLRSNRTTKAGFWKPTGKPRNVINIRTKKLIGTKRSLVFYAKAHPKPLRTKWTMYEYDITANSNSGIKRSFLLYKLKVKPDENINNECEPNHYMASPCENESQNLSVITVISDCRECEQSELTASNVEEIDSNEMIAMSTYEEGSTSTVIDSDFGNQMTTDSTSDESDPGSQLAYELENPSDMTGMSTYEKHTLCWDMTSQTEAQNLAKKDATSAFGEGTRRPPTTANPESENQNQHDWTHLPTLSVCSDSKINAAADITFLEVQTIFDELKALLESDDSSNCALLSPIIPEESLSGPDAAIGTSGSELGPSNL